MFLDRTCPLGKLHYFESGEAKTVTLCLDDITHLRAGVVVGKDHLDLFNAELSRDDRAKSLFQSWFENDPLIRRRHSLNDRFTKSPCAVDHNNIAKTALSIERKHHARTRSV